MILFHRRRHVRGRPARHARTWWRAFLAAVSLAVLGVQVPSRASAVPPDAPVVASARTLAFHAKASPVQATPVDLSTVIANATHWLVGISAVVATFYLTLGGFRYLTADGDPAKGEQAKGSLRNAGIGYGVVLLAPGLLAIVKGILGVST